MTTANIDKRTAHHADFVEEFTDARLAALKELAQDLESLCSEPLGTLLREQSESGAALHRNRIGTTLCRHNKNATHTGDVA